jgi:hypothetical protein
MSQKVYSFYDKIEQLVVLKYNRFRINSIHLLISDETFYGCLLYQKRRNCDRGYVSTHSI